MRSATGLAATLAFVAAGLLLPLAAGAQDKSPTAPSTTPSPTKPAANIPDEKLDAVAAAVKKVTAISGTYKQKLAQAPDADKQRIVGEANDAAEKAVTEQGLSVQEYLAIMQVAQNDATVHDKLMQRLK